MSKLICLVGISGSGKSFYATKLAQQLDAVYVSSDAIREEVTGNASDMSRDSYVWGKVIPARIMAGLASERTVILDATLLSASTRKNITKVAVEGGAELHCHYFEPNIERAKAQNAMRERKVPEWVIDKQAKSFQTPTQSEGFDVIINIDQNTIQK